MPPLRDAMGFIDGEEGQWHGAQPLQHIRAEEPLG